MKRIVTVFFILSFVFATSSSSKAQVIHSAIRPTIPYSNVPPLITPPGPRNLKPFNSLSTPLADTAIAYFDPDSTGNFNWYVLPAHLNLNSGTQANPIDTQFVVNRYAERFSLPKVAPLWTNRYLDSIQVVFAPGTLPTDGTNDSLVIEVRPGIPLFETISGQTNPDTLFGFNTLTPPMDSIVLQTNNLMLDTVYDTVLHLNYKFPATWKGTTIGSDFFLCYYVTDTDLTETQFLVRGDSVTFQTPLEDPLTTSDQDIYRGMWAIDDPNDPTYAYFINDYAGLQFTNQDMSQTDYFYTNFVVVAYMSNQLTNAVDENGNMKPILEQNFPNPVSSETEIDYNLTSPAPVLLTVYNQLGQQISTVVNDVEGVGAHAATFNIGSLPDGMYYYKLQSGEFTDTKTMVIAR